LNGIEHALSFQSVGEIGMDSFASDNGIYKVGDGVHEGMFVADDVARRPPVFDVGMAGFGNNNVAKSPRVLGVSRIATDSFSLNQTLANRGCHLFQS